VARGKGNGRAARGHRLARGAGGNCFNVNALVLAQPDGSLRARPAGLMEARTLMVSLGIGAGQAGALADAMADWIDSDRKACRKGRKIRSISPRRIPIGRRGARWSMWASCARCAG
jgi:type II secretory pathway component PulK